MLKRSFADNVGGSLGSVVLRAASQGEDAIAAMRAASPLPEDAQRVIDNRVIGVGLERLAIVKDWLAKGLTFNIPNPLSLVQVDHDKVSKIGHAKRTMNPSTRGENQLLDRTRVSTPVYLTMDDFQFNIRTLLTSERNGVPLDTAQAAQATRRVNEAIEDAAINGWSANVIGLPSYGLLTHPHVNTETYSSNESWTAAAHDGADILGDVLAMIENLQGDAFYGPYTLYVPTAYGLKLMEDYKANGSDTIRQRLLQLGVITDIVVADRLPADRTILMQTTDDVADIIVGQEPTLISWTDNGPGWDLYFAVLACMVPRIKSTYTNQCGIVKGYTS